MKNFSIDSLQDNPAFISGVLHATQIASRTHLKAKREALRNALLNVATGRGPEEDLQSLFLNLIDTFTPAHLRVLHFFKGSQPIKTADFLFQRNPSMFDQLVKDLMDRGLISLPSHLVARGPQDVYRRNINKGEIEFQGQITDLGRHFVAFVSSPFTDSN